MGKHGEPFQEEAGEVLVRSRVEACFVADLETLKLEIQVEKRLRGVRI